jgi:hypothetical protein
VGIKAYGEGYDVGDGDSSQLGQVCKLTGSGVIVGVAWHVGGGVPQLEHCCANNGSGDPSPHHTKSVMRLTLRILARMSLTVILLLRVFIWGELILCLRRFLEENL